jgi:hypothetical protein
VKGGLGLIAEPHDVGGRQGGFPTADGAIRDKPEYCVL